MKSVRDIACRELVELLTDYLEGALSRDEAAAVDAHLAGCDACRTYLDQLRATMAALGSLPVATVSATTTDAVLAAFRGLPRREEPPVDRSLRLRILIYGGIALVAAGVVVVDLVRLGAQALLPVGGCAVVGVVVGVVASRIYRLSWDATAARVVGRVDVVGGILLVAYIALAVFRNRLVGFWVPGPVAGAAGFAALAGIMAGQVVGTVLGIGHHLPPALRRRRRDGG